MKSLRIFVSSPGDVGRERHATAEVLRRLQSEFAGCVSLDVYFWEWEPIDFGRDYQANIPPTSDFDIVICLLWSRLGSRLGGEYKLPPEYIDVAQSGTEYELMQALHGKRQHPHGLPDLLVWVNKSPPPPASCPPLSREERDERNRQCDALQAFLTKLTRDADSNTFIAGVNRYQVPSEDVENYHYLDQFEELMEHKLRKLIQKHTGNRSTKPKAQWQGSPFRDLDVFEFSHAPIFFGRSRAVGEIVRLLQSTLAKHPPCNFTLILGASGSGKSSLARAGLLPMLTQPGVIEGINLWRCAIVRPSDDSADLFHALAASLLRARTMDSSAGSACPAALPELADPEAKNDVQQALAEELRANPGSVAIRVKDKLTEAARLQEMKQRQALEEQIIRLKKEGRGEDAALKEQALRHLAPPVARLVLLVDQMEELFTLNYAPDQLRAFLRTLDILARSGRVFVIGTLRSDFYPRFQEHDILVGLAHNGSRFDLLPPTADEISQIIRRPAALAGLTFEEDETTRHSLADTLRDEAMLDAEALPLLEHVLNRLYEAQRLVGDGRLTFAAHQALGGVGGALGKHAEDTFVHRVPEATEKTFDAVFRCLITFGEGEKEVPNRRTFAKADLMKVDPAAAALVEVFIQERLFVADQNAQSHAVVRLSHEALLTRWPRLSQWLQTAQVRDFMAQRRRLESSLRQWQEQNRNVDYLLPSGLPLEEGKQMLEKNEAALKPEEKEFILTSANHHRERERKVHRRRRVAFATLSSLTALAIIAGAIAWERQIAANQQRKEAQIQKQRAEQQSREAEVEKRRAENGFDSAFASLEKLYQEYHNQAIGSVPGVHVKEARALQEALRKQMLGEFKRLHQEQPRHRGCIVMLCRLELEAVQVARDEWNWAKAQDHVNSALLWFNLLGECSLAELEACAELWMWRPIVSHYYEDAKQGSALGQLMLKEIRQFLEVFPQSKRLRYIELRLLNALLFDQEAPDPQSFLDIERRMQALAEPDSTDLDLAVSRFFILGNAYDNEARRAEMPIEEVERIADLFEDAIVDNPRLTHLQIERASERFGMLLNIASVRLTTKATSDVPDKRRAVLKKISSILAKMEKRCPLSPVVYARYGEYLAMEQKCLDAGTVLRPQESLTLEMERHRLRGAAVGVAESMRDSLADAFTKISSKNASQQEKDEMLRSIENSVRDVGVLDLNGMDTLVTNNTISTTLSGLPGLAESDPLYAPCSQILDHYINEFRKADASTKSLRLENFYSKTAALLRRWEKNKQFDRIVDFWQSCYADIDFAKQPPGDWHSLIEEAQMAACAFVATGRPREGLNIHRQLSEPANELLKERSWDWYLRQHLIEMNFVLAESLEKASQNESVPALRRAGWEHIVAKYEASIDLNRFPSLPVRGEVPAEANAEETVFFTQFKTGSGEMVVIPCDINGEKVPVQFFIVRGKAGHRGLTDQFHWCKEYRGIEVGQDVKAGFAALAVLAQKQNVDLSDLALLAEIQLRARTQKISSDHKILNKEIDYAKLATAFDGDELHWRIELDGVKIDESELVRPANHANARLFKFSCMRFQKPLTLGLYIPSGPDAFNAILEQMYWATIKKSVHIPGNILSSLEKLHEIAVENKVEYAALCDYALNPTPENSPVKSETGERKNAYNQLPRVGRDGKLLTSKSEPPSEPTDPVTTAAPASAEKKAPMPSSPSPASSPDPVRPVSRVAPTSSPIPKSNPKRIDGLGRPVSP